MARKTLRWDGMTENIFGVQQYGLEQQEDTAQEHRRMLEMMHRVMQGELTRRQYDCLYACFLENKTQVQIAAEMGLARSTVNRHIQKGKQRIERVMQYAFRKLQA